MASGTTPVWALPYPLTTDTPNVSGDIQSLATALDSFSKRLSGLDASKPTGGSIPPVDVIYSATDTGLWYVSNGSVWVPMMVPGPWHATTPGSGVIVAPSVRLEGDVVKFKGSMAFSGSVGSGGTLCTLPSGLYNASASTVFNFVQGSYNGQMTISTSGLLTFTAAMSSALFFTGYTFTLT
jgi:hypothetical protein